MNDDLATVAKLAIQNETTETSVAQNVSEGESVEPHSSQWFCTIGVSLRGLLSLEKIDASTWVCGVCKNLNSEISNAEVCTGCQKTRLLEWMRTPDGCIVQPGEVIEPNGTVPGIENEDEIFEYGIVTDIVRLPRQIKVCVFRETVEGSRELTAIVIHPDQLRRVTVLPRDDPRVDDFLQFGLCNSCGNTYRIIDGDLEVHSAQLIDLRDELNGLEESLLALQAKKAKHMKFGQSQKVLKCTAKIKVTSSRISELRRKLSQKQLWCPFCTWMPGS